MEDLKKVRLMTNLAIYDKNFGEQDRQITSLFKRDYVYRKNLSMRIGLILGMIIMIGFYYVYKLFVAEENIFELFSQAEFIKIGLYCIAVLVLYSVLGMGIYSKRYTIAEQRCERYEKMLLRLHGKEHAERTEE